MAIIDYFKHIFGGPYQEPVEVLEEDKLLEYVITLVDISDVPHYVFDKYRATQKLKDKERETGYLPIYFALEDYIVKQKPPAVKREFSKETLRDEIRKHILVEKLKPYFQIIFLPTLEQKLILYDLCVRYLTDYLLNTVGYPRLEKVFERFSAGTILQSLKADANGINFAPLRLTLKNIRPADLTSVFKKLYRVLYEEIYISVGEIDAINILQKTYQFLKSNYDYDITSLFFDIIPEGTLENERVSFMSRESLEKQVLLRTTELEETKLHLEETVTKRTLELEEAKRHVETILTSIGDAVFAVELNGQIILMNKIAEDLSGYTFKEAQGKHYTQIFRFILEEHPGVPYGPFVEQVIATGIKQELMHHTLIVRKDGVKIPISDSAAPIKDTQGNLSGCVVVFRDSSRERELELAKDTFLSIAAHQLRTPLGSIRWNIEMLLSGDMGEIPAPAKETLNQMYENDKRLISLVSDLLNVSRIDQKKIQYENKQIDIIGIIKATMIEMESEAVKKSIVLRLDVPDDAQFIMLIDPKRFREAIENLISNAVKYSYKNGVVTVKVIKTEGYVQISVADNGIGIPEKDIRNIFSKFFRAENAIKSETDGSGLGLFVVKSFIESMNGMVWFDTIEGKGSTFNVKLPLQATLV